MALGSHWTSKSLWNSLLVILFIGGMALLSVVEQGFDFGIGNNVLQIPILQRAADPTLYPNDPFIDTLDDYFSVLWNGLSLFTGVRDWSSIFLWAHIAIRFATVASLYALFSTSLSNRWLAAGAAGLLAVGPVFQKDSPVGQSDLLISYFNHTEASLACVLIGFALALKDRLWLSAVCLGFAFNLNAFVGAWGVFILGFGLDYKFLAQGIRHATKRLATFFIIFIVVAAPAIGWILKAIIIKNPAHSAFDYRQYLLEYYPYHFLIGAAKPESIVELGCIVVSGLLAIWLLGHANRRLAGLFLGAIVLFGIGMVLPFLTANSTLLNLHLLRADSLVVLLAAIAVTGICLRIIFEREHSHEVRVLASVSCGALFIGNWLVVATGLAILSGIYERDEHKSADHYITFLALSISILMISFDGLPLFGQFRLLTAVWVSAMGIVFVLGANNVALLMALLAVAIYARMEWIAIATILIMAIWVWGKRKAGPSLEKTTLVISGIVSGILAVMVDERFTQLAAIFIAALSFVGLAEFQLKLSLFNLRYGSLVVVLFLLVFATLGRDLVERIEKGSLSNLGDRELEWRSVEEWARKETSVDAVFLVPLEQQGFGVFSQRSAWVDWKRGAAVMWRPAYYPIWKERIEQQRQLKSLDETADYARKHGIQYVIADNVEKIGGCHCVMVYENHHFGVYDVRIGM